MPSNQSKTEGAAAVRVQPLVRRDTRYEWLMKYIMQHGPVDVLNSDFVDEYVAATGAKIIPVCWGAHHCPMLGRDLAHMARCYALKRGRIGLAGNWQPGFPRWVWVYSVGEAAYLYSPNGELCHGAASGAPNSNPPASAPLA